MQDDSWLGCFSHKMDTGGSPMITQASPTKYLRLQQIGTVLLAVLFIYELGFSGVHS